MEDRSPTDEVTIRLPRELCKALHALCLYAGNGLHALPLDTLYVLSDVFSAAQAKDGLTLQVDPPQAPEDPHAPDPEFNAYFTAIVKATEEAVKRAGG